MLAPTPNKDNKPTLQEGQAGATIPRTAPKLELVDPLLLDDLIVFILSTSNTTARPVSIETRIFVIKAGIPSLCNIPMNNARDNLIVLIRLDFRTNLKASIFNNIAFNIKVATVITKSNTRYL